MPKREKKTAPKKVKPDKRELSIPANDSEAAAFGLALRRHVEYATEVETAFATKIADLKNEMANHLAPIYEKQREYYLALTQYLLITRPEWFAQEEDRRLSINGTTFTLRRSPGAVEFTRPQADIINQLVENGRGDLVDLFVSLSKAEIKRHPELVEDIAGITIVKTDFLGVQWEDIQGPKDDIKKVMAALKKRSAD